MEKMFAGKAALVTGGASGMGRAAAVAFARQGCGVIVTTDRNRTGVEETVRLIKQAGGEAEFVMGSVSCQADAERFVAAAVEKWGRLDFAFNNAGIGIDVPTHIADFDEKVWDNVIDVDLKGVFMCMKYELRQMRAQGFGGVIINNSSLGGIKPMPGDSAYASAKSGVMSLTHVGALEGADYGVRVNVICPGLTLGTGLSAGVEDNAEALEHVKSAALTGRLNSLDDISNAVIWLCSDQARQITGHALPIDGGITKR